MENNKENSLLKFVKSPIIQGIVALISLALAVYFGVYYEKSSALVFELRERVSVFDEKTPVS
jgi:hypothetical protein